jgi:hypothetical protein
MKSTLFFDICTKIYTPTATSAEMKSAQLLVAHGTEPLTTGAPSNGSMLVAEHASVLAQRLGLPLAADAQVRLAKPELSVIHPLTSAPETTSSITREVAALCALHQWERILVICAPDDAWLLSALYRKQGLAPLIALTLGSPEAYYNPNARSWRRRGRNRSLIFSELPRRLTALLRGWI